MLPCSSIDCDAAVEHPTRIRRVQVQSVRGHEERLQLMELLKREQKLRQLEIMEDRDLKREELDLLRRRSGSS